MADLARLTRPALALAALFLTTAATPDIAGFWLTQDGAGVVEIAGCQGGECGWLVGFRDQPPPANYNGVSECGIELIYPMRQNADGTWNGLITDPSTGNVYHATLKRAPDGKLNLRGYLGFSFLGQTQVWTRYKGPVYSGCRIK